MSGSGCSWQRGRKTMDSRLYSRLRRVESADVCLDSGQFLSLKLLYTAQRSRSSSGSNHDANKVLASLFNQGLINEPSTSRLASHSAVAPEGQSSTSGLCLFLYFIRSASLPVTHLNSLILAARRNRIFTDIQKSPLKPKRQPAAESECLTPPVICPPN